jgi:hypothetical protein
VNGASKVRNEPALVQPGFDQALAGKRAECDGGGLTAGTRVPGREEFTGVLTGEYVDHGDPPWRWYRMTNLSRKPESYAWDEVWCESGNLFLADGGLPPTP